MQPVRPPRAAPGSNACFSGPFAGNHIIGVNPEHSHESHRSGCPLTCGNRSRWPSPANRRGTLWPATAAALLTEFLLLNSGPCVLAACAAILLGSAPGFAAAPGSRPHQSTAVQPDADWPAYNGSRDGDHFSPLTQINRSNVAELRVAWQFDTGEKGGLQTNPLVIGRTLFGFTPTGKVIALDAATGRLLWKFDSGIPSSQPSRGFAWWTDGRQSRLFAGIQNYLYALDPVNGQAIASFGEQGRIDLRKGLRPDEDFTRQSIALTSPGLIYKDLIVV